MNVGARPETIQKLRRANQLRLRDDLPVKTACLRVGVSPFYYWHFPRKYPHLAKDAGYPEDQILRALEYIRAQD